MSVPTRSCPCVGRKDLTQVSSHGDPFCVKIPIVFGDDQRCTAHPWQDGNGDDALHRRQRRRSDECCKALVRIERRRRRDEVQCAPCALVVDDERCPLFGSGAPGVRTATHFAKEVVVHRGQRCIEWKRHWVVPNSEDRHVGIGSDAEAHEKFGARPRSDRSTDLVECREHHRPQPMRAQLEMDADSRTEFRFEVVRGLCNPLLEHRTGELGSTATSEIRDERTGVVQTAGSPARFRQGTHGCKAMWKAEPVLEAVLLVGGQGTRLRPLTIDTPKPMLPVAGRPCTEHQIARLREAGVTRVILGTSYRADVFADYFGDGSAFGVELVCVTEREPLGTGGAIRNVLPELRSEPDDPVLILNGDVLSGHDMAGQVTQHRSRRADVTLHLINVEDPRPFGLVPTDVDGRVLAFLEKPERAEDTITHQINAGCYVFSRHVIDAIPSGRVVSVERETFPELLSTGASVQAWIDDAYWLDLGNPLAFARGSRDLVTGRAPSSAVIGSTGTALILPGASVDATAVVDGGSCIGSGAVIAAGATISGSVIMDGARIGANVRIVDSIIGRDCSVGDRTVAFETVIAGRARIGADNEFPSGTRIFPAATIGDVAIRQSSDLN